jgi:L-ascorbate metabolism protein UlaG (beta-lactamase superfamily)
MSRKCLALALTILGVVISCPIGAQAQNKPVTLEWFSWSIFRLTSPNGKVILINPFVTNPDSPVKVEDFPKVDAILVADGHADEVGSTDLIALKTGAQIITTFEMYSVYFEPRKVPLEQVRRSNPGDWTKLDGITIRNVASVHGSGTPDRLYGGAAMGFVIKFENDLTVYFGGSTALTLDMQLWGRLYKPDVAILHMAANKDPQELVEVVRLLRTENPNLKMVIPHHHRLSVPPGGTTIGDYDKALKDSGLPVTLLNPELKKVYELRK